MIKRLMYKQKEGKNKGALVEIISETGRTLRLKDKETGFEYSVSIRSFQIGYERVNNV